MPKMERVDFYNEPKKKKDTKEERRKYLITGYIAIALIVGLIVLIMTIL